MQLEAGFQNLRAAARFFEGEIKITPPRVDVSKIFVQPSEDDLDFREVEEQESVKRALEIAAAGFHNALMLSPPGAGKTERFQWQPKSEERRKIVKETLFKIPLFVALVSRR